MMITNNPGDNRRERNRGSGAGDDEKYISVEELLNEIRDPGIRGRVLSSLKISPRTKTIEIGSLRLYFPIKKKFWRALVQRMES